MAPVLSRLQKIKGISLRVLAQNPAFEIYKKDVRLSNVEIVHIDQKSPHTLMKLATSELNMFKPLGVFCGISGPGAGIDEFILKAAKQAGIKRISFQDYWGYLNSETINNHGLIMVIDDYAKLKTSEISNAKIEVVGNPKYDNYNRIVASSLKEIFFKRHNIKKEEIVLGFIGQPLGNVDGYYKTVKAFSKAIMKLKKNIRCIYRPHPKENINLQETIRAILNQSKCSVDIQSNTDPIEELFAGAEVIVTLFSTAGYDAQMFNKCSDKPLASTLYLMFEKSIIDIFRTRNAIKEIPLSNPPYALTISKVKDLISGLELCMSSETKIQRHLHLQNVIRNTQTSENLIVELISKELTSNVG